MTIGSVGNKRVRLFARTTEREDGRYAGNQLGIVTVNDDDAYQLSYIEFGVRCDHIVDRVVKPTPFNPAPTTDNPRDFDKDVVGDLPSVKKAMKKAKKAEKQAASEPAVEASAD